VLLEDEALAVERPRTGRRLRGAIVRARYGATESTVGIEGKGVATPCRWKRKPSRAKNLGTPLILFMGMDPVFCDCCEVER
jgi:hypothetical protein